MDLHGIRLWKRSLPLIIIAFFLTVLCLTVLVLGSRPTRIEYLALTRSDIESSLAANSGATRPGALRAGLNSLGADGWRLVAIAPSSYESQEYGNMRSVHTTYIFSREQ